MDLFFFFDIMMKLHVQCQDANFLLAVFKAGQSRFGNLAPVKNVMD